MHELFAVALEKIVLTVLTRDDQFEVRRRTHMASDFQQHDVVEAVVAFAACAPQIGELRRILLIGQEAAAAGGLRVLRETESRGKFDLRFSIAAVKTKQVFAIHPAFALRQRRRQVQRRQRSQQSILRTGFARDQRHRVAALRHRPLADDFAGDDEVAAVFLHESPRARLIDHEDLAVETRIQMRPVAVFRIQDDVFVRLGDVDDVEFDAELFGNPQRAVALRLALVLRADRVRVPLNAESREEVQAFDVNAFVDDDSRGEHRIETTGNQRDSFSEFQP